MNFAEIPCTCGELVRFCLFWCGEDWSLACCRVGRHHFPFSFLSLVFRGRILAPKLQKDAEFIFQCLSECCDYGRRPPHLVYLVLRTEPELVCARQAPLSSTPGRADTHSICFLPPYPLPQSSSNHGNKEDLLPTCFITCSIALVFLSTAQIIQGRNTNRISHLIYSEREN